MSKDFRTLIVAAVLGLALTVISVAVPHHIEIYPATMCNSTPQTQTTRGYPFGYLLPDSSLSNSQTQTDIACEVELGAASATDTIAQHTPGHLQVYGLINNHTLDRSSLVQDFVVLTLVALYPASLIMNKYALFGRRK